ncbi:MAG: DUF1819 family protein [Balneolaceae bacterium]|nr:DUF1819 family protein [Balneolaceae bacterium]
MKYRFSFTGASAMISEFIKIAELVHQGKSIDELNEKLLGREKVETNRREFRELKHRINSLTPLQIEILTQGNFDEQKQITHLALCKTYRIYRDFVVDVLAEKVKVYDHTITDLDYNSFISKKSLDHPELENLAETTKKKVKQVMFRMLQQVGIIDTITNSSILTQQLTTQVEHAIIEDDPALLACFFYREEQVKMLL